MSSIRRSHTSESQHISTLRLNNESCVQVLVDKGAALDARDVHGRTPLHLACIVGYQCLIGLLDPSQINYFLHIKDNCGCTPLYYACKRSHLECIREFMVQIPDICNVMKVADKMVKHLCLYEQIMIKQSYMLPARKEIFL